MGIFDYATIEKPPHLSVLSFYVDPHLPPLLRRIWKDPAPLRSILEYSGKQQTPPNTINRSDPSDPSDQGEIQGKSRLYERDEALLNFYKCPLS